MERMTDTARLLDQGPEHNAEWAVDDQTRAWQRWLLGWFDPAAMQCYHHRHWRKEFGDLRFPPLYPMAHHFGHALAQSPFDQAVCLTIDGSGDQHTAVVWRKDGDALEALREVFIPHSLGWFYAAITEYLGFEAYDGEYKVMGLAAYGRPDPELQAKVGRVVGVAADGIEFRVEPRYLHHGAHTWSGRFTDELVELLGRPPRRPDDELTRWHEDLAYAAQDALEVAVSRLVLWGVRTTGIHEVCIGGGVGLNVKMNSRLFEHPEVDDLFAQPLCSDSGAAIGAALAACLEQTGARPEPLRTWPWVRPGPTTTSSACWRWPSSTTSGPTTSARLSPPSLPPAASSAGSKAGWRLARGRSDSEASSPILGAPTTATRSTPSSSSVSTGGRSARR